MSFVFPPSPSVNDTVLADNGFTYLWDGVRWLAVGGGGGVNVDIEPPPNPDQGTLWWDQLGAQLYVWSGHEWVIAVNAPPGSIGPQGPQGFTGETGATGATGVRGDDATSNATVSNTAPPTPGNGAVWFDTDAGELKVWSQANDAWAYAGPPRLPAPTTAWAWAPIMLAAANGAPVITGQAPILSRNGNTVTCTYVGANKTTATANTVSFAWIPDGFQPIGNVQQTINLPASTVVDIQRYTTGTNVFPDAPATNVTTANTRWVMRATLALSAAMSLQMTWQTADPMPVTASAPAPLMLTAANAVHCLTAPPQLHRVNNLVECSFKGLNRAAAIGTALSFAWVPEGFRPNPIANVSLQIMAPAIAMNVQRYAVASSFFPDTPGASENTGVRWSLRPSTSIAASAAVDMFLAWQTIDPMPVVVTGNALVMLDAVNGNPVINGRPSLTRLGDVVMLSFVGANKATATAFTMSFAWIPEGFQPTANVSLIMNNPNNYAITVQRETTGTNVFPDNPGVNVTTGNTRWVMRSTSGFTANQQVDLFLTWRTADPMPRA